VYSYHAADRDVTSQHKEPQHPPDQEKSDDYADNVADPLAGSFGTSEIEHTVMLEPVS
jgi:hypothetical protein